MSSLEGRRTHPRAHLLPLVVPDPSPHRVSTISHSYVSSPTNTTSTITLASPTTCYTSHHTSRRPAILLDRLPSRCSPPTSPRPPQSTLRPRRAIITTKLIQHHRHTRQEGPNGPRSVHAPCPGGGGDGLTFSSSRPAPSSLFESPRKQTQPPSTRTSTTPP